MRLDKYLKVSRLIKRRTVANEACDNGRISVNGKVVKASYDVKVGDKIEISMGARTVAVEVLVVAETVKKDDAAAMYKEVQKIVECLRIPRFFTIHTPSGSNVPVPAPESFEFPAGWIPQRLPSPRGRNR